MVALALNPGPKQPAPEATPSSFRTGPLMMTVCAAPDSVPVVEWQLPLGWRWARTAATTVGKYSGRQPAMTAFAAACSAVHVTSRVGTVPSTSSPESPAHPRKAATLSGVGGMTGSPSVQPLSK